MDKEHDATVATKITEVLHRPVIERLREVLAERQDVVVTVGDMDGCLLWGSRAGSETMFRRLPEAYLGRSRFDYIHPGDVAHVRRLFAQAVDGETSQYTCRAVTAEGDWRLITSLLWRADGPSGPVMVAITVPAASGGEELVDLVMRMPRMIGP